jgi:hypothetical protein
MAKCRLKYFIVSLLLFAGGFLEAQTGQGGAGWRVYQTAGNVIITQNGVRALYQGKVAKGAESLEKITLKSGDIVQTSNGKAEMQIASAVSRDKTYTVVKICENTTVLINESPGKGGNAVELLYGRIRVITGSADSGIVIRAGSSVANIQNGDVALDFIAKKGVEQPVLTFHCFNGKGDFVPRSGSAPLDLKANETIFMDNQDSASYVEKKPLEAAVVAYWKGAPFTDNAPLPSPALDKAAAPAPEQGLAEAPKEPVPPVAAEQEQKQQSEKQQKEKLPRPPRSYNPPTLKDGLAITGFLLAAAGAGLQAYTLWGSPPPAFKDNLYKGSYIPLGVGVAFILGSSLFGSGKAASD